MRVLRRILVVALLLAVAFPTIISADAIGDAANSILGANPGQFTSPQAIQEFQQAQSDAQMAIQQNGMGYTKVARLYLAQASTEFNLAKLYQSQGM